MRDRSGNSYLSEKGAFLVLIAAILGGVAVDERNVGLGMFAAFSLAFGVWLSFRNLGHRRLGAKIQWFGVYLGTLGFSFAVAMWTEHDALMYGALIAAVFLGPTLASAIAGESDAEART